MKKIMTLFIFSLFFILSISATELDDLKQRRDELKIIIENNNQTLYSFQAVKTLGERGVLQELYDNYKKIEKRNKEFKVEYGIVLDEIELYREREYPTATDIWRELKNFGFNDYVGAGIMGNLMVETGGKTLNIKPYDYSSSRNYYGICQWSKNFYPKVHGTSLEYQIQFLFDTIEYEFNTFGDKYKKGFTYEDFCNLQDTKEAALAFAKVYERCAGGYTGRKNCAVKAYEYYVS